jgi:hypothetical protein
MKFRNPANNHVEEIDAPVMWTLLLGCFYLAYKGAWVWAVICLFIPFAWIAVAFFAEDILRKQYLGKGWIEEEEPEADVPLPVKKRSAAHQRKLDEAARRTFGGK